MSHKNPDRISEYEFSIGVRLTHWIRFIAITLLIVSGYYISYVFMSPEITSEPTNFHASKVAFGAPGRWLCANSGIYL